MSNRYYQALHEQNPGKYPENLGKPWTDEEILALLLGIRAKKSHSEIAENHKRTIGGILSRLNLLAWEYYSENKSMDQIQKLTGLTKDQVVDSISRHQAKQMLKEKKKEQKQKLQLETISVVQTKLPLQITDSKSIQDVYALLQELARDIREIKDHLGLI